MKSLIQTMRGIKNQIDFTDQTMGVDRAYSAKSIKSMDKTACRECPIVKVDCA